MRKPDAAMIMSEVAAPPHNHCSSGHEAPSRFRRDGPNSPEEPTRFFQVTCSNKEEAMGVFCEPCLVIANAMARRIRREHAAR